MGACTLVAINQNDKEKEAGLMRLNFPLARDLEFSESTCVWCAGCLAVANPVVLSCY